MHLSSITYIVAPAMIIELVIAILLVVLSPIWWTYLNLLTVGLIWAATFLISVPSHNQLEYGSSDRIISRLVRTNWIRTFLWSSRLIFLTLLYLA